MASAVAHPTTGEAQAAPTAQAAAGPERSVGTQADIDAFERIPLDQYRLPTNTYGMLVRGAETAPDAPALSFFLTAKDFRRAATWSHRDLLRDITRTANALRRLGIGRRDVVAFVLPNLPETHFVIWGGEAAGIVFAINPLLDSAHIAELLRAGRAKWLVTLEPTPGTDLWEKSIAAVAAVPTIEGVLTVGVGRYVRGIAGMAFRALSALRRSRRSGSSVPVRSLRAELARERGDRLSFDAPEAGDVSSYVCTGGTTGLPKIAVRTHGSEVFDAWATQAFIGDAVDQQNTVFCGLPLFHVNGQLATGLAPWSRGAQVVIGTPQGYRGKGLIDAFWAIAEHYRVNAFSGVPTVYSALLQVPVGSRDISRIRYGFCGAAPMPVELFRNFETATGIRIIEAYGLTEGACVSSINPPEGERRIGSIGLRLPHQKMAVVILGERGFERFAEEDEVGALAILGPNVFAGYVDPKHDKGIWIEIAGERWLNTGDLARQDGQGYFWLTGRRKELIIRGGHNIDPKIIEDAVQDHPAVQLAAAIGRPDTHAGEVPVLYVQLKPGASASAPDLLDHARARIPERAAHPKAVKIIDALPVTPVGKIFKPALSMREIEDVVRCEAVDLGIALRSLSIEQDAKRGILARISVGDEAGALRERLGAYTFATEFG